MDTVDGIPEQDEYRFEQIEKIKYDLELEIKKQKKNCIKITKKHQAQFTG